jgi:uncharacterized protein (DUF924 family)
MSNLTPQDQEAITRINQFWFPTDGTDLLKLWFYPDPAIDTEIKSQFLLQIVQARSGSFDHWASTPHGTLALLILLDQFPRNIFRSSPDAFSSDAQALSVAVKAIAAGQDREMGPNEVVFFYLPLMHSEELVAQVAAKALFEGLIGRAAEGTYERNRAEKGLEHAIKHLKVIERFGRFPKRNEALGRKSTSDELKFLEEHPQGL